METKWTFSFKTEIKSKVLVIKADEQAWANDEAKEDQL